MKNMKLKNKYVVTLCVLVFIALCFVPAHCQVAVTLAPVPKLQFLDGNGNPISGGCVFTYAAGTTNQQATYNSSSGTVQNANPVILDSAGRASIWITSQSYKFAVWTSGGINCASGVQQYSIDNISAPILSSVPSITSASSNPASTGWERLANGDLMNWRNFSNSANIGFTQAGAAAAGNGNISDVLRYGDASHGAVQAQRFVDFSSAPAQSGVIATGNNVCAVASRNAAGNADSCLVKFDGSNVLNLSTSGGLGVKLQAGPLDINSGSIINANSIVMNGTLGSGELTLSISSFATLPTPPNGSVIYCSDCNSTCTAGSSTGRTCFRENGAWTH